MNKPFSKELFNEHNDSGIQAAIRFLQHHGYTAPDTTEAFKSHDIIMMKNNQPVKIEVEKSTRWTKEGEWQGWPTVSTPYRKRASNAALYIRLNQSMDTIGVIRMDLVKESPVRYKNTIYTKNEPFFETEPTEYDFFYKHEPINENRYLH